MSLFYQKSKTPAAYASGVNEKAFCSADFLAADIVGIFVPHHGHDAVAAVAHHGITFGVCDLICRTGRRLVLQILVSAVVLRSGCLATVSGNGRVFVYVAITVPAWKPRVFRMLIPPRLVRIGIRPEQTEQREDRESIVRVVITPGPLVVLVVSRIHVLHVIIPGIGAACLRGRRDGGGNCAENGRCSDLSQRKKLLHYLETPVKIG
jgi:hypothetical protein